jgi:hypothetical protein
MLYDNKYCWRHITKPIPSIVGGILQSPYQVLLLSCNIFVRSHCRLYYTHINRLYTILSTICGILQSLYQVLLLSCKKKAVSYTFSLFNDHQEVTGTDFDKICLRMPSETCIHSLATICCSLKSSIIRFTKCCI